MTVDIFNTENRYDLILADPPWKQSKGGKKSVRANSSGRPLDYQVCTLEEIEEHLKAAVSLTGGNSILFLWTIDKYLFEAQEIAERLEAAIGVTDMYDPYQNIRAGLFMLRELFEKYDDPRKVLMAYNMGEYGASVLWEQGVFDTTFTRRVLTTADKYEAEIENNIKK